MDLARQKHTLDSLMSNLEVAHSKLIAYHKENHDETDRKWITKNIIKDGRGGVCGEKTEEIQSSNP